MTWYRVYCVLMTLLYLVFVAVGVFFIIAAPADRDMSAEEARLLGGIMFFMVLLWQSLPDRRIPAKQALGVGVWTGLDLYWSNECLLSAYHGTLLIHWIKPETKFYLGRT